MASGSTLIREQEKICSSEDEDIILCKSLLLQIESANENSESRADFLLNFNLRSRISDPISPASSSKSNKLLNTRNPDDKIAPDNHTQSHQTNNKKPKITRNACSQLPFSSPAGQILIKKGKFNVNEEFIMERFDRTEKLCSAPVIPAGSQRPSKFFKKRDSVDNLKYTFRKPDECSTYMYTFPRKQYYSQYRADSLKFLNDLLLRKRCRPVQVKLKKTTKTDTQRRTRIAAAAKSDLKIKLIREQSHKTIKWRIANQQKKQLKQQQDEKHIIIDFIDLCSSDEEEGRNKNALTLDLYKQINDGINEIGKTQENFVDNDLEKID